MSSRKLGSPRSRASRLSWRLAAPVASVAACLAFAGTASAASMSGPISGWQMGTEPSWVSMYEYVPTNLQPNAPILVLIHYCGGNAAGVFGEANGGGIIAAADKYGFLIVLPQTSRNCWDIATTPTLTHNGGGDSLAIVHQVKYAITKHSSNANRVYVTGTSSGAMMTEGLLAVYPEVFKGGSEFAGVPAGCWAVGNMTDGQWSGSCAGGQVTHTAAEWGTMVKNMYPGYTGFRPRIQLWHGDADTTIRPANQTEAIKQWTNVLGLPTTPTSTTMVTISAHQYKREQWQDACMLTVLDAWTEVSGPHGTDANLNATYTIPFLTLDKTGAVDIQAAGCAATAGAAGNGGGAGTTGAGGSISTGAAGTTGGAGTTGTGGRAGTTGSAGTSGSAGTTGTTGESGTTGTTTGLAGTFGSGSAGTTGTTGESGTTGTSTGTAGTAAVGTGAAGDTGSSGTGDTGPGVTGSARPGCACDVGAAPGAGHALMFAGAMATLLRARRRRRP